MNLVTEWRAHLRLNFNDEPLVTDVRVLSGRDLLTIVGQGGSGYFFERAAQKACVTESAIDSSVRGEGARDADRHSRSLRSPRAASGR